MEKPIYARHYPTVKALDTISGKWYLVVIPQEFIDVSGTRVYQPPLILQREEDSTEFLLMEMANMTFYGPVPDPYTLLIENLEMKLELRNLKTSKK